MSNFRPINPDTRFLLPPSVDEWLPQRRLARFVVEVIDRLELSELEKSPQCGTPAATRCGRRWRPSFTMWPSPWRRCTRSKVGGIVESSRRNFNLAWG
jgi:hypothetical protein